MLSYEFMQRAFIVAILISILIPCIGLVLVMRRHAMLGDALSHVALAGVCYGILAGWNPTIGAIGFCVLASFMVSFIGRNMKYNKEIAIAIILSLGVGISGILSSFISSQVNLNSFLFGSIVAISDQEFTTIILLAISILCIFFYGYDYFMFYAFDDQEAKRMGVPIKFVDILYTFMVGITISISARIVGALIVSSLLVIPAACGLILGNSYRSTMMYAIALSLAFMIIGLSISYYLDLRPGGSIILISCICYMAVLILRKYHKS